MHIVYIYTSLPYYNKLPNTDTNTCQKSICNCQRVTSTCKAKQKIDNDKNCFNCENVVINVAFK